MTANRGPVLRTCIRTPSYVAKHPSDCTTKQLAQQLDDSMQLYLHMVPTGASLQT